MQPEAKLARAGKYEGVALAAPGGRGGKRRKQRIVSSRAIRRATAILDRAGHEDNRVVCNRELSPRALAPQFDDDVAVAADLEIGNALRAAHRRRVERQ